MAKLLSPYIVDLFSSLDLKMRFVLTIGSRNVTSYLINWQLSYSKDFGAAQATFVLNNDEGLFGEDGVYKLNVGDIVSFVEYFGTDTTPFPKFYGIVSQRSIAKTNTDRSISLVCLDYIGTLEFLDIELDVEGDKAKVENEILTPNYLPTPNENLAHVFNFANEAVADNPRPIISIRNKNTTDEDPAYDGYEITYDNGQLKLGFPLNARYNYDLVAVNYYFYTKGVYAEDVLEAILLLSDGYGNYMFGEQTPQAVIDNHLTEWFQNVEGAVSDEMIPNYLRSEIPIEHRNIGTVTEGSTSLTLDSVEGLPTSGEGTLAGDVFSWTGIVGNTLTGIPTTGSYSIQTHPDNSVFKYTVFYEPGRVWYLKYSHILSDLTDVDFLIPGGTISYFDKRYGRIILTGAISTSSFVWCNSNYKFHTLQASGIELNRIQFRSREVENRLDAVKKLKGYLAPNYVIRTRGDNKIWSGYLSQRTVSDYTLQLATGINYLEDEDLYTRTLFYGKNNNPNNIVLGGNCQFMSTGNEYKGIATLADLAPLREEGGYYIYGSPVSGIGRITANSIKPIVYINGVPIDNRAHLIAGQQVVVETTTRTDSTTVQESGGK